MCLSTMAAANLSSQQPVTVAVCVHHEEVWCGAGTPQQAIRAALLGQENLPWEEASEQGPGGRLSALRTLRDSVMSCLCRYAERRPTADELAEKWRNLLDFSAVRHTVVNA